MGRLSWITQMGLEFHHVYYKRETEGDLTQRRRKRCDHGGRGQSDVTHKPRNAGSHSKLEEARSGQVLPHTFWRECSPLTLHFRFLASRTVRDYISVVLSHLMCGTLLWPQETIGGGASPFFASPPPPAIASAPKGDLLFLLGTHNSPLYCA